MMALMGLVLVVAAFGNGGLPLDLERPDLAGTRRPHPMVVSLSSWWCSAWPSHAMLVVLTAMPLSVVTFLKESLMPFSPTCLLLQGKP